MKQWNGINNIYDKVKSLIVLLQQSGEKRVADTLSHCMYEISWTTGSELLEELLAIINNCIDGEAKDGTDARVIEQMKDIAREIRIFLNNKENI